MVPNRRTAGILAILFCASQGLPQRPTSPSTSDAGRTGGREPPFTLPRTGLNRPYMRAPAPVNRFFLLCSFVVALHMRTPPPLFPARRPAGRRRPRLCGFSFGPLARSAVAGTQLFLG